MTKQLLVAAVFGLIVSFTKQPNPVKHSPVNKNYCKHLKNKVCNPSRPVL